jgi:hypothetical protein
MEMLFVGNNRSVRVNHREANATNTKGTLKRQFRDCVKLGLWCVEGHKFGQKAMRKTPKQRIAEIKRTFFPTNVIFSDPFWR